MQTQPALSISPPRSFAPAVPSRVRSNRTDDAPAGLAALGTVVTLSRGAAAYREGDHALHWYRVVSGTGCTSKLLSDGRRQIGTFLHSGDVFGFEALDENGFTAEALTDMVMIRYSRQRTEALAQVDGAVSRCIHEIACRSLTSAYERLLTLGRRTATERVATFLLELARTAPDGRTLNLSMSRGDIGDYLGLTLETVSRTLATLKQERLIEMAAPHRLVLLDLPALEDITKGNEPALRVGRA
jgi:CRP-like cAMP-binding protein